MELSHALDFTSQRRTAVLTTLHTDGRPQQSVIFYVQEEARFLISITESRAKTRNLRRDPRAALWVGGDNDFEWVALDGTIELSDVASDPNDAVCDALVDYYRRGVGEHDDWDDYRRAMVADGRLIATFAPISATGILPD